MKNVKIYTDITKLQNFNLIVIQFFSSNQSSIFLFRPIHTQFHMGHPVTSENIPITLGLFTVHSIGCSI